MEIKKEDGSRSGSGQAARQILDEIISGGLKAGGRLYIRDLMMRTGLKPTPLREGMSRLVATGLVEAIDQRGFQVARIERSDVEDYTAFRLLLEHEALRRSIREAGAAWERDISSAVERMENVSRRLRERPREALLRFSKDHKQVHVALVSACRSRRLKASIELLCDQEIFYCHNLVDGDEPLEDLMRLHDLDQHRELVGAALARDADAACILLSEHQWLLAEKLRSRCPA